MAKYEMISLYKNREVSDPKLEQTGVKWNCALNFQNAGQFWECWQKDALHHTVEMALDHLKLRLSQNTFHLSKNHSKHGPRFPFTLFSPLPLPLSLSLYTHTDTHYTERALNSIPNSRNFSAFSCPWRLLPVLKVIILESFWESFSFCQYNLWRTLVSLSVIS